MKVSHPNDVIRRPIITEESTIQSESHNKFVFQVDPRANKVQIKDAIERQFDVKVVSVNTMNYMGKVSGRRGRGVPGRKASWKKAIVTLGEGHTIDLI